MLPPCCPFAQFLQILPRSEYDAVPVFFTLFGEGMEPQNARLSSEFEDRLQHTQGMRRALDVGASRDVARTLDPHGR